MDMPSFIKQKAVPSRNCDICFITLPNNWYSGQVPYFYLVLAGYLESRGLTAEILDFSPNAKEFYDNTGLGGIYKQKKFNKKLFFGEVVSRLRHLKPKFVGISIFTLDYFLAMELAAEIKSNIDCKIVMGNVHASLFPNDCIYKDSPVDFVVIGEGEETLYELLTAYNRGEDFKSIAGLYLSDNGESLRTPVRSLMNIDNLPLMPFDKINMGYYLKPRQIFIRNLIVSGVHLFTGRGCPYFCQFCAADSIYKAQGTIKRVRFQSLDNVFANIDILTKKYKIDGLYIFDDTFTILENRVLEFCERIRPYNIYWGADTRVNLINPKMLKAMKESGCLQLDFGVETGSPEMLKKVSKGITIEQTKTAFKMCEEAGIRTLANILVNLPGETENDIEKTEQLLKTIRPTVINVSILKPYPATQIFEENIEMDHIEYITNLRKFLDGDLSIFKLCSHDLDLKKVGKKLKEYAGKNFLQLLRDISTTILLICTSRRKKDYIIKTLKIPLLGAILMFQKLMTYI